MTNKPLKLGLFYSLKFQLVVGAVALLAFTLTSISYLLIENQKRLLVSELQNTIILQGRNVALSSLKGFLRPDPEFELVPLVTRLSDGSNQIESLIITDSENVVQADLNIQNIGSRIRLDLRAYGQKQVSSLSQGELLFEDGSTFLFKTPVTSGERLLGFVYMTYSKRDLLASITKAIKITVFCGAGAFVLGILLSLLLFKRISQPMDAMMEGVKSLGDGDLSTRIEMPTRNEFRVLANSFNVMASQLLGVQQELVTKKIMDRELEIAHDIQNTLIPDNIVDPTGYELGIYYQAAMQVGGDYVDVIRIDRSRLALVVADVSGKGIPGLVIMAMLKFMVHDLVRKGMRPTDVVRSLNTSLSMNVRRNMFVTMLLAVFDTETGTITYSNAGHNPILHYDSEKQSCSFYRAKGRPLALFADRDFFDHLEEGTLTLAPGDLVLLYTDGLNESMNVDGQQFGYDKLSQVCKQHAAGGAKRLVEIMVKEENRFRGQNPQNDDLTLLALGSTSNKMAETIG